MNYTKPKFTIKFLWFILMLFKSIGLTLFHLTLGIIFVKKRDYEYEEDVTSKRIIRFFVTGSLISSFYFNFRFYGHSIFWSLIPLIALYIVGNAIAMTIVHFDKILMEQMGIHLEKDEEENEDAYEDYEEQAQEVDDEDKSFSPGYFDGLTPSEAKAVYKALIKMYHPDNKETGNRAKAEEIIEEYRLYEAAK